MTTAGLRPQQKQESNHLRRENAYYRRFTKEKESPPRREPVLAVTTRLRSPGKISEGIVRSPPEIRHRLTAFPLLRHGTQPAFADRRISRPSGCADTFRQAAPNDPHSVDTVCPGGIGLMPTPPSRTAFHAGRTKIAARVPSSQRRTGTEYRLTAERLAGNTRSGSTHTSSFSRKRDETATPGNGTPHDAPARPCACRGKISRNEKEGDTFFKAPLRVLLRALRET